MKIPTRDELLERIEAFLKRHEMAETRFAREATGEPSLISTIRAGRSPTLDTLHKLANFMDRKDAEQAAASGDLDKAADAARRVA